jgi:uncharacterized membrane protein YjfL (UPF0719 family)
MEQVIVNVGIIVAYALVILGVVLAIVFPLINAISQPQLMMKAGIGIVAILVIYGIGYALAGSDLTTKFIQSGVDSGGLSRSIGGALMMVYLLMGVAILGIVYTEFSKALK